MSDYQLIIVGSGPAGTAAAAQAARLGLHTAVIENDRPGGTCLNRGCIPTKALLHVSGLVSDFKREQAHGILEGETAVNPGRLFAYKDELCAKLSGQVEASFRTARVDLVRGKAVLLPGNRVRVGERILTAEDVILAAGSVPVIPPIPGMDLPEVMTSDEILKGQDRLPSSLVIIGGGVIGIEFATFYSDLGVPVTILEGMERILPALDREISQNLARILKKRGVTICTKAMVTRCEGGSGSPVTVRFKIGEQEQSVTCENVLCAVGRKPDTEGLLDEELRQDLKMDGRRIAVDEYFRTSVPHVCAVGDLSSGIQLAHAASAQGTACVNHIAGKPSVYTADAVPSCIFTRPEIAAVGLNEQTAKDAGIPAAAGKAVLFSNARTVLATDERCFMKVLAGREDHRILGAQLMCGRSSEMISEITEAIVNGLTVEQMLAVIRPHPTFHEALTDALRDLAGKLG